MTDAIPFYFGQPGAERFAWFHPADPTVPAAGALLLCNAIDRDEGSVHRSLRHVAGIASAAGIACLRFDWSGRGNSCELPRDGNRLPLWLADVHEAIDILKSASGVTTVGVAGVRSGAMLAALACAGRPDVHALVAVAPIVAGRLLVREWKAMQGGRESSATADGSIDAGGFLFNAQTCLAFTAADLVKAECEPAPSVMVIDRVDLPSGAKWIPHLREQGAAVYDVSVPGLADMLVDPHHTVVPTDALRQATQWLVAQAPPGAHAPLATPIEGIDGCRDTLLAIAGVSERCESFDADGAEMFGVWSFPPAGAGAPHDAVLLINGGATRHVGPHGWYATLARRLAASGCLVLRVDLAGLGDTSALASEPDNIVYPPQGVSQVAAAMDHLQRRFPALADRVQLAGLCSGAYHSLKAAVAGVKARRIVLINPLAFFWKPGLSLDPEMSEHRVAHQAASYGRSIFMADRWLKLMRGEVDVRLLARVVGKRMKNVVRHRWRDLARRMGVKLHEDLAGELARVAAHGTDIAFIFADDDPGHGLLGELGGFTVGALERKKQLSLTVVDNADHTFSSFEARAALFAAVEQAVRK